MFTIKVVIHTKRVMVTAQHGDQTVTVIIPI